MIFKVLLPQDLLPQDLEQHDLQQTFPQAVTQLAGFVCSFCLLAYLMSDVLVYCLVFHANT